eukprot:TRINITY_DN1360_c0_g1_i1.p1 TRINITY_DN1360_c0_g1~~TRINITY_DN1360_c0_g1_i1.p1  ORF type:complete len:573 (+),score=138.09 TRINITY_DN1360_c0_g1_i1:187-1905(+)
MSAPLSDVTNLTADVDDERTWTLVEKAEAACSDKVSDNSGARTTTQPQGHEPDLLYGQSAEAETAESDNRDPAQNAWVSVQGRERIEQQRSGSLVFVDEEFGGPAPASDVDGDACDCGACEERKCDYWRNQRQAEKENAPRPDYMDMQTDINAKMRCILLDWLLEVSKKFKTRKSAVHLASDVVDRHLSRRIIGRKRLQLLGVTALLVASKFEGEGVRDWRGGIEVSDCVYICGQGYCSQEDVLGMEVEILNALNFKLCRPTVLLFADRFSETNGDDEATVRLTQDLLEVSLLEIGMIRHPPSLRAAAASCLCNVLQQRVVVWPDAMVAATGYWEQEAKDCALELYRRLTEVMTHPLQPNKVPTTTATEKKQAQPATMSTEPLQIGSRVVFVGPENIRADLCLGCNMLIPPELLVCEEKDGIYRVMWDAPSSGGEGEAWIDRKHLSAVRTQACTAASSLVPPDRSAEEQAAAALRNYEQFYSLKPGTAKMQQVKQSSAGLEGWASARLRGCGGATGNTDRQAASSAAAAALPPQASAPPVQSAPLSWTARKFSQYSFGDADVAHVTSILTSM